MKQDAQTNQTKPTNQLNETQTNPQKNQIKPTGKTRSLCGFRFSRRRELERLKRKIRVKKNKLEVAKRDGRRACELQLGRETQREASQERNKAQCVRERFQIPPFVWVFEIHEFKLIKF